MKWESDSLALHTAISRCAPLNKSVEPNFIEHPKIKVSGIKAVVVIVIPPPVKYDFFTHTLLNMKIFTTLATTLTFLATLSVAYPPRCSLTPDIVCPKEAIEELFPVFCGQPYTYPGTQYGHLYVCNRNLATADCGMVAACTNPLRYSQERLAYWG